MIEYEFVWPCWQSHDIYTLEYIDRSRWNICYLHVKLVAHYDSPYALLWVLFATLLYLGERETNKTMAIRFDENRKLTW